MTNLRIKRTPTFDLHFYNLQPYPCSKYPVIQPSTYNFKRWTDPTIIQSTSTCSMNTPQGCCADIRLEQQNYKPTTSYLRCSDRNNTNHPLLSHILWIASSSSLSEMSFTTLWSILSDKIRNNNKWSFNHNIHLISSEQHNVGQTKPSGFDPIQFDHL